MVGGVHDVITCAKFQIEIFMGYDFTGGRIFDFCIDFSMGLTTVQRYCAACDFVTYLVVLYFYHLKRPGYNTEFLLYPRPLGDENIFAVL